MTDGLTPIACEKINRNFRRLVALCTTETQGRTVYNSYGQKPSGSGGDAQRALELAQQAIALANQAIQLVQAIDDFVGADSSHDGVHGLVPAPAAAGAVEGDERLLASDATWEDAYTRAQTAMLCRLD